MNRNLRIARELVRMARELVAEDNRVNDRGGNEEMEPSDRDKVKGLKDKRNDMEFWKFLIKNCRKRLNQMIDKPKMSMKLSDFLDELRETYEHGGKVNKK